MTSLKLTLQHEWLHTTKAGEHSVRIYWRAPYAAYRLIHLVNKTPVTLPSDCSEEYGSITILAADYPATKQFVLQQAVLAADRLLTALGSDLHPASQPVSYARTSNLNGG
jgi:hypothetical protein